LKEQVAEFMANLLSMGTNREQVSEKGYEYALALQTDQMPEVKAHVPASMMARAAELVRDALPEAYRIYERRHMMR
jgi:hypothetical protein